MIDDAVAYIIQQVCACSQKYSKRIYFRPSADYGKQVNVYCAVCLQIAKWQFTHITRFVPTEIGWKLYGDN